MKLGSPLNTRDAALIYVYALSVLLVLTVAVLFVPEGDVSVLLGYLVPQIAFASVPIFYIKHKGAPFTSVAPLKKGVRWQGLLLIVPITVGVFLQNTVLAVSFSWLLELIGVRASVTLPEMDNALNIVLALLFVCVAPAFGEEIMYRGVMLNANKSGGLLRAVMLSALIFSLSHFNAAQIVHQFILGAILAYTVCITGNMWYAVGIHFLNNLFALFLGEVIPAYNTLAVCNWQNALIMLGMCVVGAAILYPSLFALGLFAGKDGINKKEFGFSAIFGRKESSMWYNSKTDETESVRSQPDYWLIGLLTFLSLALILSTVMGSLGLA